MTKAIFLDRDGTLNVGVPVYERVDSLEKVELLPNTLDACRILAEMDYLVFLVTNQAGLAEGLISWEQFNQINDKVFELIAPSGIKITKTFVCPHGENEQCDCRKPSPKLLLDAAGEFGINLSESFMIGDRHTDVMTGKNAGVKTILVKTGRDNESIEGADFVCDSLLEAVELIKAEQ